MPALLHSLPCADTGTGSGIIEVEDLQSTAGQGRAAMRMGLRPSTETAESRILKVYLHIHIQYSDAVMGGLRAGLCVGHDR
jgi:hypothetical protein